MLVSKLRAALIALALAGCASAIGIERSPTASPGPNLIPPSFAGNFFTEICLTTAPGFEGAHKAIAGEPFVQHEVSEIFFHKFADLSIKVSEKGCSLVFRSELGIDETVAGLAEGVTKNAANWGVTIPRNIEVTSNPAAHGEGRYFRIGLRK